MSWINRLLANTLVVFIHTQAMYAQPIGTWRIHTSLYAATSVEIVGENIFCGTQGGLYYIDRRNGRFDYHRISRDKGLSGTKIETMKYVPNLNMILVAYNDGNIDLIDVKDIDKIKVTNLPYVSTATNIIGSKKINHIELDQDFAWLACDFGILQLDLKRVEIKETLLTIGPGGENIKANHIQLFQNNLYVSSDKGLLKSKSMSLNLLDSKNWERVDSASQTQEYFASYWHNNTLTTAIFGKGLYTVDNGKATPLLTIAGYAPSLFKQINDTIYFNNGSYIMNIVGNGRVDTLNTAFGASKYNDIEKLEQVFVFTDFQSGLFSMDRTKQTYPLTLNSPRFSESFKIRNLNDQMVVLSGGYDGSMTSVFNASAPALYTTQQYWDYPNLNLPTQDLVDATYVADHNTYYFASHGRGLLAYNLNTQYGSLWDDKSGPCKFTSLIPGTDGYVRVSSVWYAESEQALWIVNSPGPVPNAPAYFKYKFADNTCQAYTLPPLEALFPIQILMDRAGQKWVRLNASQGGGIVVFDERHAQSAVPSYRLYKKGPRAGNLTSNENYDMVIDKEDQLWIASNNGIAVINDVTSALASTSEAYSPLVEGAPLFFEQNVYAIRVDAADRKWIGTANGAFLLSKDGTRIIRSFNTDNSPLLSNVVKSLEINQQTGEVFFGTDLGLVSYMGDATEVSTTENDRVKVFPNPVKANVDATIGLTHLPLNAQVHIVDINGILVYKTQANGTTATWNGRDYNNKKVQPGIYILYAATSDGSETARGKIFVE